MSAEPLAPPEIESSQTSNNARRLVWLAALPLIGAAIVLFAFDPQHSSFYPGCTFKHLTGWSCSACGCLRATHQLLHGNLTNAFHLNPLYIVLLPVFAWIGILKVTGKSINLPHTGFGCCWLSWSFLGSCVTFRLLCLGADNKWRLQSFGTGVCFS